MNNVQSIIFDKNYWTVNNAKQWLKKHNYKIKFGNKKEHITKNFIRFRQKQPNPAYRYRMIELGDHIDAVMMYPLNEY